MAEKGNPVEKRATNMQAGLLMQADNLEKSEGCKEMEAEDIQ